MRLKIAALLGVALVGLSAVQAKADLMDCYQIPGSAFSIVDGDLVKPWYKNNVDTGEEDTPGKDLFETEFGEDPADPKQYAKVSWDPAVLTPEITDLVLKVGNVYYMTSLAGVDLSAYDCIVAWNPQWSPNVTGPVNGISHITFNGQPGDKVPDGGLTAMLLGLALSGMGATRRLLKK